MAALRADLVFSYWIFAWYILYAFKFTEYSPKFPLIIGLLHNIIMLVLMLVYGTSKKTIVYFVIINTIIKAIPLYYLRKGIIKRRDVYFTFFLLVVFVGWLYVNKQNVVGNLKGIRDSLLNGQYKTPLMGVLHKIETSMNKILLKSTRH
jgi:hypothetical protein